MPKLTVPTAGGAMPAASRKTKSPDIVDVQDELCRARHGVQAAHMAARALMKEERDPLTTILDDALERIVASEAFLEVLKIREKANA
jgi:hypothetical protein